MKKIVLQLVCILFLSFFISCEKEEYISVSQEENRLSTKKVTVNQVLSKISNSKIREKVIKENQKFTSNLSDVSNSMNRLIIADSIFTMIEYNGNTSFLLALNTYSIEKPYFLKLAINIDENQEESFGILKYLPTNPTLDLDLKTFTGIMQILDIDEEVKALSSFDNGVKIEESQTYSRCYDIIRIIPVRCGQAGNHAPGVPCNDGVVRSHYTISVQTICNNSGYTPLLTQVIEDSNYGNYTGGINIGMALADNWADTELNNDQRLIYDLNPSIREYLASNVIIVDSPNYNPLLGGEPTMAVIEPQAREFVLEFLLNSVESGLNLDFEKSLNSPANIDFSAIDQNTPEGQQFTWIYSKLMESDIFRQMFTETFQVSDPRINVKFEVTNDGIPDGANGICRIQGSDGNWHNTIKIRKSIIGEDSNLSIAKTILHECIHAYLNIKKIDSNLGTTIAELNGLDLGQLLGTFTGGFGGVPVANGTVTQHDFMFTYMLPVFTNVLADLKEKLISQTDISAAENQEPWVLSNDEVYNFNWPDLYYYLSLNGLHNSAPFQSQYPVGSIDYEKYYYMQDYGVFALTKTSF